MKFPYGQCECPHPNPTEHKPDACPGPAALRVTRDGKVYKLCTRCDLITDQDKEVLITENDDLTAFLEWDDFGLAVVLKRLDLTSGDSVAKAMARVMQALLPQN